MQKKFFEKNINNFKLYQKLPRIVAPPNEIIMSISNNYFYSICCLAVEHILVRWLGEKISFFY